MTDGLTAEQIKHLWLFRTDIHGGDLMAQLQDFARAVEAAHGITGEQWTPLTPEQHTQAFEAGDLMALAEEAGGARMAENVVQVTRSDIERIMEFVQRDDADRAARAAKDDDDRWLTLMCDLDDVSTLARAHALSGKEEDREALEAKKRKIAAPEQSAKGLTMGGEDAK